MDLQTILTDIENVNVSGIVSTIETIVANIIAFLQKIASIIASIAPLLGNIALTATAAGV